MNISVINETVKSSKNEDSDEMLKKCVKWYDDFVDVYQQPLKLNKRDRQYYDGKQWTDDEIEELRSTGQSPIVINVIMNKMNAIFGVEIETRTDPVGLPVNPSAEDDAAPATDVIRYWLEKNEFDDMKSEMTEYIGIEGFCGFLAHVKPKPVMKPMGVSKTPGGRAEFGKIEPRFDICLKEVPPDRLYWDVHSRKKCFSDAKYLGIITWMDRETFEDVYGSAEEFDHAYNSYKSEIEYHDDLPKRWVDSDRDRILINEVYYERGGVWYSAHHTRYKFIKKPTPVPFVDDNGDSFSPLIMQATYRDGDNGYPYGVVRNFVDPQTEINKRRSKALHLLSVRQTVSDRRAIQDVDTMRNQLARPDGHVELDDPNGRFDILPTNDMAQAQFQLLAESKNEINLVGPGVSEIGAIPASSGREAIVRQKNASYPLKPFFDGIRFMQKRIAQRVWYLARQYMSWEDWIRVRDDEDRKGFRFVGVNRRLTRAERFQEVIDMGESVKAALNAAGWAKEGEALIATQLAQLGPEAQQMLPAVMSAKGQQLKDMMAQAPILQQLAAALLSAPEMQEVVTYNNVAQMAVDIVLSVAPDTAVIAQEEFDKLVSMYVSNPNAIPFDMVIEASQLRDKRKILDRLRGQQQDPAAAQAQQQAMQLQARFIEASAQESEADAMWKQAKAQKAMAETQEIVGSSGIDAMNKRMEAEKTAAETQGIQVENQAKQVRLTKEQADAVQSAARAGATVAEIQSALLGQ